MDCGGDLHRDPSGRRRSSFRTDHAAAADLESKAKRRRCRRTPHGSPSRPRGEVPGHDETHPTALALERNPPVPRRAPPPVRGRCYGVRRQRRRFGFRRPIRGRQHGPAADDPKRRHPDVHRERTDTIPVLSSLGDLAPTSLPLERGRLHLRACPRAALPNRLGAVRMAGGRDAPTGSTPRRIAGTGR